MKNRPVKTNEWIKLDFHFVCPECGSTYFGSSINADYSLTRHCHGTGCKFSWNDRDDEKYVFVSWKEARKMRGNMGVSCLVLSLPLWCIFFSVSMYLLGYIK